VFVSDGRSLRALDQLSGRPAWVVDVATPSLPLLRRGAVAHGRTALDRPFAPTLWRDLVIATLEVDRPYSADWLMNVLINTYLPQRALVAVDRQRGTLRWVAGEHPLDRLRLEGVHFASEAAVADDLVFAVGSRRRTQEDVGLFAFHAATGALAWERPLAYGQQETNLFGNPTKEFSAGAVSVADGVVYAQTGLGCLAAVDARSGTPRWLASYAIDPIPKVQAWYIPPLRIPRVGPVAPVISGDAVVVAPGDGLHLSAFDRRTGALRWRVPHGMLETKYGKLGQVLGVARVHGREAVLATGAYVDAYDLANGRLLARGRFEPEQALVVGQGAIAGRTVLVPTTEGVQRFALDGELRLLGRDPWPKDAQPGNLLPLGQVLVVTGRESVHGYYSWDDVERDIARRREERPRDPEVLVEAGEVYLRGRGGPEARRAFEAALALADPASPIADRARRGLVASWLAEGDAKAERDPGAAAGAYRRALEQTTAPAERASVRLKLDAVLPAKSAERIENLERLYEESGRERGREEDGEAVFPIGPITLMRLSAVEAEAGHGAKAVAALQRMLREQGDVQVGAETAADLARRGVAALIQRFGPEAYAEEEARARALMARADPSLANPDAAALERVLREYPNASVVPAALLGLGQKRLTDGWPAEAAERFRQVLARHPDGPEALTALALLARAYGLQGALGGRRAALASLAERGTAGRIVVEGRARTPAEWAAEERAARPDPPPGPAPRGLVPPLAERAFEPPSEDPTEITVPVPVAEDESEPSTIALTNRGSSRAQAYDLLGARASWALEDVAVQRAAHALGTLVLSTRGAWRGVAPADGTPRWERPDDDPVHEVIVARGQVVSWGQQGRSRRRLKARDPLTGDVLWTTALGGDHVYGLRAAGPWVLLTRARYDDGEARTSLLVFDGVTGTLQREIPLPPGPDRRDLVAGSLFLQGVVETEGRRGVAAVDLATGRPRWSRALASAQPVTALAADGPRAWVLQQDGTLTALLVADGAVDATTRLALGERGRAHPAPNTQVHVADGRLTILLSAARGAPTLLAFELATGRLAWEVDPGAIVRSQQHSLFRSGDRFVLLLSGLDDEQALRVLARVVDARSGEVEQQVEPEVRATAGVVALDEGFGSLVLVTSAGTSLYGAPGSAGVPAPEGAPR
jgi:outer membrane protein assembly factor BamB